MGKNKPRNRDRARREKSSGNDNIAAGNTSTSASNTKSVDQSSASPRDPSTYPDAAPSSSTGPSTPAASELDGAARALIPNVPAWRRRAIPATRKVKRDSSIPSTSEHHKKDPETKASRASRRCLGLQPSRWWPCRFFQWTYRLFVALTRVYWNDQRKCADLILTLAIMGLFVFGIYLVLEFLTKAFPVAAAQSFEGNCSVVYVTVPGPIITISLVAASPTNPARGTYYFSVVNGTTGWLNSVAPPSRFSTLVTRTPVITPVISSLSSTRPSASGAPMVPPTMVSRISVLPVPVPSTSTLGATSPILSLTSSTLTTSIMASISGSTAFVPSLMSSSGISPSPGTSLSLVSSLPGPINQPQRPYPSYPPLTSVPTTGTTPILPGPSNVPSDPAYISPSMSTLLSPTIPSSAPPAAPEPGKSLIAPTAATSSTPDISTSASIGTPSFTLSGTPPLVSSFPTQPVTSAIPSTAPEESTPTTIDVTPPASADISLASSSPAGLPLTSTGLLTSTSSLVGDSTTTVTGTSITMSFSLFSSTSSTTGLILPTTSSIPVAVPSTTLSNESTSSLSRSDGFTISLSEPSANPSISSSSILSTTLGSSLFPSESVISSASIPVDASSSSSTGPSTAISETSSLPSVPGSPATTTPGLLFPNISSTSITSSSPLTSSQVTISSLLPLPSPSQSAGSSLPANFSTSSLSSSTPLSTTGSSSSLPLAPPLASSFSVNLTSSFSSSSSLSTPSSSALTPGSSASFVTLVPSANVSSSSITDSTFSTLLSSSSVPSPGLGVDSSVILSSSPGGSPSSSETNTAGSSAVSNSLPTDVTATSSSLRSSFTSSSTLTSASTLTAALPVASSASPSSNGTSLFIARAMTKVISYGENEISFVFPSPRISTTQSYWTGVYPTVTGPLPSDLATIPLTTRTKRQTPLSEVPSFDPFSSRSKRFKTVVTRGLGGNETSSALAKRQGIPITVVEPTQPLETAILATSTVAVPDGPGPSSCGESGNFTLSFDDTVVDGDDTVLLVANGMKNPYHHLFYANGYTYVPDMWEPYPAISQPNIAMFLPLTGRLLPNTPFAGTMLPGELGAGPRASVNAYWFNAYSAYFGCALNGLTPCTLRISGYRYDEVLKGEVVVAEQNVTIPACWGYINCRLTRVFFNDQFRALSGIQFNAYTYNLNIPQVHMMDDLQMEWYNNTCSAGILRIGHR